MRWRHTNLHQVSWMVVGTMHFILWGITGGLHIIRPSRTSNVIEITAITITLSRDK